MRIVIHLPTSNTTLLDLDNNSALNLMNGVIKAQTRRLHRRRRRREDSCARRGKSEHRLWVISLLSSHTCKYPYLTQFSPCFEPSLQCIHQTEHVWWKEHCFDPKSFRNGLTRTACAIVTSFPSTEFTSFRLCRPGLFVVWLVVRSPNPAFGDSPVARDTNQTAVRSNAIIFTAIQFIHIHRKQKEKRACKLR